MTCPRIHMNIIRNILLININMSSNIFSIENLIGKIKPSTWTSLTVSPSPPSSGFYHHHDHHDWIGKAKARYWKAAGGVSPWMSSSFEPLQITQKYFYSDAPHIFFILIDDWGYNDPGFRSTYMSWTTPTFDRLKEEGVLLEYYYTNEVCAPSRGSFLTGRYNLRLGKLLHSLMLYSMGIDY